MSRMLTADEQDMQARSDDAFQCVVAAADDAAAIASTEDLVEYKPDFLDITVASLLDGSYDYEPHISIVAVES